MVFIREREVNILFWINLFFFLFKTQIYIFLDYLPVNPNTDVCNRVGVGMWGGIPAPLPHS